MRRVSAVNINFRRESFVRNKPPDTSASGITAIRLTRADV